MSESQPANKSWCGTVPSTQAIERASKIKLLLMDVDSVLTDGKVYYVPQADGKNYETKGFDSHDGLGLHFLRDANIESGFISGRESQAVIQRASNMHVKYVRQGSMEKEKVYQDILSQCGFAEEQIAYIGDDFPDIPVLKRVGLACVVANARAEVKPHAHFITQAQGGQGAAREVIELILKAQDKWQSVISKYAESLSRSASSR